MDISSAYSGDELGLPYRDLMIEGVVSGLTVSPGTGNTLDIAAGSCWVLGDSDAVNQPLYRCINDATVNKGVTPDPSNPRIVTVVAQINDATFAGALRNWTITVIHGTPAASPVSPAVPASALWLTSYFVPAASASSAAYINKDPLGVSPGAQVKAARAHVPGGTRGIRLRAGMSGGGAPWNIATGTDTAVQFTLTTGTQSYDTGVAYGGSTYYGGTLLLDAATHSLFTAPFDGVYTFEATIIWQANATGVRSLLWRHSVGPTKQVGSSHYGDGTRQLVQQAVATRAMLAGESMTPICFQNSGATLTLFGADTATGIVAAAAMHRIGEL